MDTSGLTEKKMKKGKNGKRGSRFYSPVGELVARTCATCDEVLPLGDFPAVKNTKDGVGSNCKECTKSIQETYRKSGANRYTDRSPEEVEDTRKSFYPGSIKICESCGVSKDLSQFYHNSAYRTGVSPKCKTCTIEESIDRQKRYAEEDPDYYKKAYRKYKDSWKDRTREEMEEARTLAFPSGTRECRRCLKRKSIESFSFAPSVSNATASACKECINKHRRDNEDPEKRKQSRRKTKARTTEQLKEIQGKLYPEGTKECKKCRETLPLTKFIRDAYSTDGLRRYCNRCRSRKCKDKYESHWRSHNIPFECYICQGPYEHSDHVIPTKLGGSDDPANRLPICAFHNGSKNGDLLEDWLDAKHHDIMANVLDKVVNVYNVEISPVRK